MTEALLIISGITLGIAFFLQGMFIGMLITAKRILKGE